MNVKIYKGSVQPNPKEYKIWVDDEGIIKTWSGTEWVKLNGGNSGSGNGSGSEEDNGVLKRNDVNFFDYDGTLLYAYTWEEAKNLTSLPALPKHPGLEVREWNYTLDDIKVQGPDVFLDSDDTTWVYAGNIVIGGTSYRAYTEQGGPLDGSQYMTLFTKSPKIGDTPMYVELDSDSNSYGDVKEYNFVVVDTYSIIGKVDVGVCVYDDNGEQVTAYGVFIFERGLGSDGNNPGEILDTLAWVVSIPNTATQLHDVFMNSVTCFNELKIPASVQSISTYYGAMQNTMLDSSIWWNGYNRTYDIPTYSGKTLELPPNFTVLDATNMIYYTSRLICHKFVQAVIGKNASYVRPLYDFTKALFVPILTVSGLRGVFVVPDALYDLWINATNWSNLASNIMKQSDIPWLK